MLGHFLPCGMGLPVVSTRDVGVLSACIKAQVVFAFVGMCCNSSLALMLDSSAGVALLVAQLLARGCVQWFLHVLPFQAARSGCAYYRSTECHIQIVWAAGRDVLQSSYYMVLCRVHFQVSAARFCHQL
jgi:hypothetical protein